MKILLLLILLLPLFAFSQNNDTINRLDSEGKKTGYWIITGKMKNSMDYTDTSIVEHGNYLRGRKIGTWKKYYPSGKIKNEIEYQNGRFTGHYISYYISGCVEEERKGENSNFFSYTRYADNCNLNISVYGEKVTTKDSIIRRNPYYSDCGRDFFIDFETKKSTKFSSHVEIVDTIPPLQKSSCNGYAKLYNSYNDIILDGEFINGALYNGRFFVYDQYGLLDHIRIYKNGIYCGKGKL